MNRKVGQLVILTGVMILVLVVVWFMYRAQNGVQMPFPDTGGLKTDVIGSSGYQPPQTGYSQNNLPTAKSAVSKQSIAGIETLTFVYGYGEAVVLNSLPTVAVTSNTDIVRWVQDSTDLVQVQLADAEAIQTYFYAPNLESDLHFQLQLFDGQQYVHVANFLVRVFSTLTFTSDLNQDGVFTFEDLVLLLQQWPQHGSDAVQMLAVILSRYGTP